MRRYQPIWLALKKHKTVTIKAPISTHARVIKAVIKEKWLDKEFKNKEGWRKMWLRHFISTETGEITFRLTYRTQDLVAKDL